MSYLLEVCLIALTLVAGVAPSVTAQSQTPAEPAMQKGISVQMPVTGNAVSMPGADRQDALIVVITNDGSVYFGTERVNLDTLAGTVKSALSNRTEKTLYIKADARTSYASVAKVIDAVRISGVEALNLLTAQREPPQPGTIVPPKGIRVWLSRDCAQTLR
jgi:biopolymer transport protein TolR